MPAFTSPDPVQPASGRAFLLRLLPVIGFGLLLAGCGDPAPAEEAGPPARPVQVITVALTPLEADKSFVGVVRARREIDQSFRVGGKVVQRFVDVGQRVQAGQVIATLDPQDLRLQLESAEAEFAAATANLAQTAAEDGRYRTLTARGFASNADLDRKSVAKEEAAGRLERARRSLDLARNQLAYTDLKADADGVVMTTSAEPGQVVTAGQTVARIARLDEKEAAVALPETALASARTDTATVTLWAEPDRVFKARLRELSPQADATSRTYAARFSIENADDTVALGMTTFVILHPTHVPKVARLPLSSVFDKGAGPRVFVVDPTTHTLEARPVTVAGYTSDSALVSEGLNGGEQVVTMGVQTLDPGRVVRTVPAKVDVARATPAASSK
ncbi:efflux RND transporter periplasmic adaptor subunit [Aquabacter sp. L1I39]|uniref:efflux RND transporter periplasmic adaptor subunit n=1 Tax=Aquabacter sp. L1I39 TaxID=2820278 RepID=UPI001ADBFABA|nr:efflux RND transporter periplasmic adaptor subunit [Aquabacter sp. L1I39]QTL04465.1 efflux RND transporter periplasmic adaptor subunit [Aquabacter sp. L1I39]